MSDKDLKEFQKKVDNAQVEVQELETAIAVLTDRQHTPASLGDSPLLDFLKSEFSAVVPEFQRREKLKIAQETLKHAKQRLSERQSELDKEQLELDCQQIQAELKQQRELVLQTQAAFRRALEDFEALAYKHEARWNQGRKSSLFFRQQVGEADRHPTFSPTEVGGCLIPYHLARASVSW